MIKGLTLNIADDHGSIIRGAVQAVFETLDGSGSVSGYAVDVFAIATLVVAWSRKAFALDGKELLVVLVAAALDHDGAERHHADVGTAAGILERFLEKLNRIKTLPT